MMGGAPMMLRLSVDNLATPPMVRHGSDQSLHFRAGTLTVGDYIHYLFMGIQGPKALVMPTLDKE